MDNFNDCVLRDCGEIAELKAVDMIDMSQNAYGYIDIKNELEPYPVFCSNCPFNDGMVYTSLPPQYKCTKTNEWHLGSYGCGRVYRKTEYVYQE